MDSLTAVLNDLPHASDEALTRAFQRYESYLRMIIRRRFSPALRAKFDSADVVQSIWADLLGGFREHGLKFETSEDLRRFLAHAARNRFVDYVRRNQTAMRLEQPDVPGGLEMLARPGVATASETAQADDVWLRLLALCPPKHRELLLLRRQGLSSEEIAKRTGLNDGSVRRIICELARKHAAASHSDPRHAGAFEPDPRHAGAARHSDPDWSAEETIRELPRNHA